MLNMLDTQDKLKNFSEAQLIQEMQMPSGSAPQFMVLGEIERRKRMRQDAMRQEGLMQPTVAQEAVSAAGVPQQGIAQVAQSLAPKTDMTQNTGVPSVQAAGLPAQPNQPVKMADGGRLTLMQTDPATIAMASRMGMSVDDYISSLTPSAIDANLQRIARAPANQGRVYDDVFSPQRPVYAQGVNPLDIEETYDQMRDNIRDEEIMALGVNPSFATDTRDREYGIGISDRMATPSTSEGIARLLSPDADSSIDRERVFVPAGANIVGPDDLLGEQLVPVSQRELPREIKERMAAAAEAETGYIPTSMGATELNTPAFIRGLESEDARRAAAARKTAEAEEFAGSLEPFGDKGDPVLTEEQKRLIDQYGAPGSTRGAAVTAPYKEYYPTSDELQFGSPKEDPMYELAKKSAEDAARARDAAGITDARESIGAGIKEGDQAKIDRVVAAARGDSSGIAAVRPAGGAGGSGGSGGAAPAEKSGIEAAKSKMDQDKWLALAQAGLTLMSTGDFGKAGSAGLAALRQSQSDDREERKLEAELLLREAQMAAANRSGRGGGSSSGLTANQLLSRGNDLIKSGQSMLEAAGDNADAADEARALIEAGRNLIRQVTGGTSTSATGAIKLPSAG